MYTPTFENIMKLYGVTGYPWQVLAPLMVVDDESVIVLELINYPLGL